MGKSLYDTYSEAKRVFNEANRLLGFDIKALIFDGDEADISDTKYSQLGLFITSCAFLAVLDISIDYVAGLSSGEYTALFASHRISFEEALNIINIRASLMRQYCIASNGAMVAVLGLPAISVEALVGQLDSIWVANYNTEEQTVVSGKKSFLEQAIPQFLAAGARRVVPLKTAGAFHTPLMQPANDEFVSYLKKLDLKQSSIPIAMNTDGLLTTDNNVIIKNLCKQMVFPVLWKTMMQNLKLLGSFLEIGSFGLTRLNKKNGISGVYFSDSVHIKKCLNYGRS